jgi:pantothenate kinase type III
MPETTPVFADLGNTTAKFLLPDGTFIRAKYSDFQFDDIFGELGNEDIKIVYSSVNPNAEIQLKQFQDTINAQTLLTKTNLIKYNQIKGIGADRLFGLAGAIFQSKPPIITIDCGTAVTLNVLNTESEVVGGIIMPGIKLREYALRTRTTGLNNIKISPPEYLLGKNTDSAVSAGIYFGIGDAVSSIINRIKTTYKEVTYYKIFLTGGDSLLILPYLNSSLKINHDELLVIKGIKYIYEEWLTKKK